METQLGKHEQPYDLVLQSARGSCVYDASGKEYIDFMGGSCVGNLGWGLEEIEKKLRGGHPSYVSPHAKYKPWEQLAEMLVSIAPGNMAKCFRTTGGSESIDAAMQMAMLHTGREHFLSIEGAYHGNTIGALSIGASMVREKVKNLLPNCHKLKLPLNNETLEQAGEILQKKDCAAFIMEPIITNMGVYIPSAEFMEGMQQLCKETRTLFVMDEVATGFGRTGKMFASEHFGIGPDIVCLAKAITSGYAGMGAVLVTEEIAHSVEGDIKLYSTYGWHPQSVAAALANLEYWQEHETRLLENTTAMGALFEKHLHEMEFPDGCDIRIMGLAIAIDVKDKEYAESLRKECLKKGLFFNVESSVVTFFPALNIEEETVAKGLSIFESCVMEMAAA